MGFQCRFSAPAAGGKSLSARMFLSEGVSYCDLLSFVQLAQRPLFRAAPGACLLLYSRSLKRPGFPRANRRMFEERLLLGIGVELPDARWIAVHEHRKARTEGLFAGCQKLAPLLATAQNSGLAGANSGVLRQVRKRHHAIPDLSRSFLDGERLYRIHTHTVENDVSVLRDLEQENTPLLDLPAFELDSLHPVHIPRVVEHNLSIRQYRQMTLNGTSAGLFEQLVESFLREGVKDDGAGGLALLRASSTRRDRVQSLTPASPVLPLAVSPIGEKTVKVSHLFPAALFVVTQSSLSPIECLRSLLANVGVLVVSHGFELRLRFGNSSLTRLSSFPQVAYQGAEGLVDLPAFLVYLPVEGLSPDHSAEVAQRKNILAENADLFAGVVIKLPNDIRVANGYFPRHGGNASGLFCRQPWCLGEFSTDPLDHVLIHLDVVLERVQCVLQLIHQFVSVVAPPASDTVVDQVRNHADLIATSLHGNVRQVPPRGFGLGFLILLLLKALAHVETALHKAGEIRVLKDGNQVEVEIAAIAFRGLRVQ